MLLEKLDYCNHVLALMFKCCKFSLHDSKDSRDLNYEDDQNPAVACTSTIQRWHQKGGGQNIVPHPVMEVEVDRKSVV